VVAAFAGPDVAHAAMAKLEQAGVAPNDVRLLTEPGAVEAERQRRADERTMRWFEHRWLRGVLVGALLGAVVIGLGVSLLMHGESAQADVAAAIGGGVAGAFIGGFIAVGLAMPRNLDAWDTFLLAHDAEVCVAVTFAETQDPAPVVDALERAGATSVVHVPRA
jgi:hypothetical protein